MRHDQFQRQATYTDRYLAAMRPGASLTDLTKEYVLSLHREADEILDQVPWKPHRRYDNEDTIRSNVAEEIVDVIKFALGLAHVWGLSYEDLQTEFDIKSDVVEDRWRQEHGETAFRQLDTRIALLDLDGVLNEYPEPFLRFARELDPLGVFENDPAAHERIKHAYRESGIKRTLPPIPSSILAAQMLHTAGYSIVIMSQRPVERHHRIYGDTLYWLKANDVPYDRLLFVPDKQYKLLLAPYLSRIEFAVDDDPAIIETLTDLGLRTYWITPDGFSVIPEGLTGRGIPVRSMLHIPEVQKCFEAFRKELSDD